MSLTGKKLLVTGADGFIGSHLVEALVETGADVTALTQYNSFDKIGWLEDLPAQILNNTQVARGDIRDQSHMDKLIKGQEIVFHLAALIAIPHSYEAPQSYIQTNVIGTANILSGALNAGCSLVVHTSTSEVYGTALTTPIKEDHPLQAQSPYAASKIAADKLAESFHLSYDLPVVTLRPFNTYGPRQSERAVISTVIRQILDPACDDIRVGSLEPERDFNYVGDTVGAFLAVSEINGRFEGRTFNAGSGKKSNIGYVVELLRRVTQCEKAVVTEQDRVRPPNSEVFELIADANALRQVSNWTPSTTLEDGLAQTVEWWRHHLPNVRTSRAYSV